MGVAFAKIDLSVAGIARAFVIETMFRTFVIVTRTFVIVTRAFVIVAWTFIVETALRAFITRCATILRERS